MLRLGCVVIEDGRFTSVQIEASRLYKFPASQLSLYHTKRDGQWLSDDDSLATTSGALTALFCNDEFKMKPSAFVGKYIDERASLTDCTIHVLVQLPPLATGISLGSPGRLSRDEMVMARLSEPLGGDFVKYDTNFVHQLLDRAVLVNGLIELLTRLKFVFVRAPSMSGKTTLSLLVYRQLVKSYPGMLVARIAVNRKTGSGSFSDFFQSVYGCSFYSFCSLSTPRAVIIDEAQLTYEDQDLWLGVMKDAIDGWFKDLKVILFSSFGCFFQHARPGTPVFIRPAQTVALRPGRRKPGLALTRAELDELACGALAESVGDLVWDFCSGHIGIAPAVLNFLETRDEFKNRPPGSIKAAEVELMLRSTKALGYVLSNCRSIPTAEWLDNLTESHAVPDDLTLLMVTTLNNVAAGELVLSSSEGLSRDYRKAKELLTKFGLLYEEECESNEACEGRIRLQFASKLHLKVWLWSNRHDPIDYMKSPLWHKEFLIAAVTRMDGRRLRKIAAENKRGFVRERQMQHELYRAVTSCAPRSVFVDPEWRTVDGKGYIDLMIRKDEGEGFLWIWELLCEGDRALEHSKRFQEEGKYFQSIASAEYAIIDFRQTVKVRERKEGFVYVTLIDDYARAKISGSEYDTTVTLINDGSSEESEDRSNTLLRKVKRRRTSSKLPE